MLLFFFIFLEMNILMLVDEYVIIYLGLNIIKIDFSCNNLDR